MAAAEDNWKPAIYKIKMKEFECDICRKKFGAAESLEQHKKASHGNENPKKHSRKGYVLVSLLLLAVLSFSYTIYLRSQMPGQYDDFAKCLAEKGVVIYGDDFCQYTTGQLNGFGNSQKYLKYVKCADNKELCDSNGVKITPTWEINGKVYEGVQNLQKLADLSGCKI